MMTPMELQVWLLAYASNQPHPFRPGVDKNRTTAPYWAACAVFHLRNGAAPTDEEVDELFTEVQSHNARQAMRLDAGGHADLKRDIERGRWW